MAISKIIYKSSAQDTGTVWMDTTQKTVTSGSMLSGTTALKNDGTDITGNIASKTSSDLTANVLTVTAPAGYYESNATKTLTDQYLLAENIKKDISIFGVTGTYEGGGGGTSWETVYSGQINLASDWGGGHNYASINPFDETIALNSVWRVTWDNVQYECTATWEGGDTTEGNPYAIGNYTYDGGSGGNNEPFYMQKYWLTHLMIVGASGWHTVVIEKQVSGGGSNWTLLASEEFAVNTSSTSNATVGDIQLTLSDYNDPQTVLWVHVRDKAGKRTGYFYGSDTIFIHNQLANGNTNSLSIKPSATFYTESDNYKIYTGSNTYGVFAYSLSYTSSNHYVQINSRYNASYSLTVNGTYKVDVYKLTMPTGMTLFEVAT